MGGKKSNNSVINLGGFFKVTKDKKDDPNEEIEWGETGTEFHSCPHCKTTNTVSYVQYE